MKYLFILPLTFFAFLLFGQETPTDKAKPIVAEGKRLYKSEMASWYGTDLFLENYKNRENIGGYFSYSQNDIAKCVFFSRADRPKVIGEISFDSTYDTRTAKVNLTERDFNPFETDLFTIRKKTFAEINSDTVLFKTYQNTNFNVIPLINDNQKKVYVLTGTAQSDVVIIGNDYLLTFDKDNNLTSKKQLHQNIITMHYGGKEEEGKQIEGTMHTHLPETGEFITATDICTLMLYGKFAKWKQHNVVSKEYLNIWNCQTDELVVIPMNTIRKISEDQKDRKSNNK